TTVTPVPEELRGPVVKAQRAEEAAPAAAEPDAEKAPENAAPAAEETAEQAPLSPEEVAQVDAAVRKAWQQWTEAVEAVCTGKGTSRVSEGPYQTLHGHLLTLCRSQTGAPDAERRARYQRLEAILEPWLTARVLADADRGTLA